MSGRSSSRPCEAIEAYFSWGVQRCGRPSVGEAIDGTWGSVHNVCADHLPGWTNCDHQCDPSDPRTRRPDAQHFLDCPVWVAVGVVDAPTSPGADQ